MNKPVPKNKKLYEKVNAAELWNEIIESAHASAEPGVLFWDTIERNTPGDVYEKFGFKCYQ